MAEPTSTLELGDPVFSDGDVITYESDGTGSAGDAVTISAGQVTPTSATDDDFLGILNEDSPDTAGEPVEVNVQGVVVANVEGTVSAGDVLEPTATAGQLATNGAGTTQAVDEGGTATYTLAMEHPQALSDEATSNGVVQGFTVGTNAAIVKLP